MKNVTYIAGAVVFNDKGEVLLMQEAKVSCAGTWYLPAGRVEPGEQIIVSDHCAFLSILQLQSILKLIFLEYELSFKF